MITIAEATAGTKLRCLRDVHTLSSSTEEFDIKFREGDEVYVVRTEQKNGVTIIQVNDSPDPEQPGVLYATFEGKPSVIDEMFASSYEVVL